MRLRHTAAASLLLALLASPSLAQPRPMTAVDLLGVVTQQEVRLAPDGRTVLLVRSHPDWEKDAPVQHLWRASAESAAVQMTNGADGESSPRWSPDGTRFCFVAKRGSEKAQLWLQPNGGGEAIALTSHETSVSDPTWTPDGRGIFFVAEEAESKEEKERKKRTGAVVSYDRDFKQKHLWMVDVASKAERRITEGDFSVLGYSLSGDGATLVYHAAPSPLVDDADEGEVWIRPLAAGPARRLTTNAVAESDAAISPDGRTVLFTAAANERFEPYYEDNLFLVPAGGGAVRMLLPDFPHQVLSASWARDGRIVLLANMGVRTQLFRLDPARGSLEQLTRGEHAITSWHLDQTADAVAFVIATPASPGDVWIGALRAFKPVRITRFGDELPASFRLPKVEAVRWKGRDGREVEGILTYPLDHTPGVKAPLVVQIHGGPAGSSTLRFPSWGTYTPLLAARGFAVLDPNYRGSTGYGDEFLRDMVGHYYHECHHDVLAGVDHLVAAGIADPDRLAIMGWSAGGHMTNWMITQTDRFKAASSGAGASNWISMYGQSDVRTYRTPWFLGTPWQDGAPLQTYLDHSPITHVAKAKTPTLILVGEKDVRVPMAQSVEMFRALRSLGVESELLVFPGAPHGLRTLKHRLHKINSEIAWFEKHVRGAAYEMEQPPKSEKKDEEPAAEAAATVRPSPAPGAPTAVPAASAAIPAAPAAPATPTTPAGN